MLFLYFIIRYHRSCIEAANDYVKDSLNKDELLINVIDYFTQKWNHKRSDGTFGLKKEFIFDTKDKDVEEMAKNFPGSIKKNVYESYRDSAPQTLKKLVGGKHVYNKRKLNEFLSVINKISSKKLSFEIMKDYLYKNRNADNFFNVLQKFSFDYLIFSEYENESINLILPASYYGHNEILEWLVKEGFDINGKNERKETGLHLGTLLISIIINI